MRVKKRGTGSNLPSAIANQDIVTPIHDDWRGRLRSRHVSSLLIASFVIVLVFFCLAAYLWLFGDPNGGRPMVTVSLQPIDIQGPGSAVLEDPADIAADDAPSPDANAALNTAKAARVEASEIDEAPPAASRVASTGGIALAPAPNPNLVSDGKYGSLPVIGPDGLRPADAYARPFDFTDPRPRIALVVGGLGLSKTATAKAIRELPPQITLSFAPYPENLQRMINQARENGHEVMLQIPMEPFDYPQNDPGDHTLLSGQQPLRNLDDLEWLLSRFSGYAGVSNYLGAKFTSAKEPLRPILEAIDARGLFFLDDGTSKRSLIGKLASEMTYEHAVADKSIDLRPSRSGIELRLLELENIARRDGVAIGVGSLPYPLTIDVVAEWAQTLEAKGFALAPITAAVQTAKK
jgi:hypothetical protein